MTRREADFLVQLAVHSLLGRFAMLDAALGKLPGMLVNPLAPKNLVLVIAQDDADIRAVAVAVEHGRPGRDSIVIIFPQFRLVRNHRPTATPSARIIRFAELQLMR